MLTEKAKIDKLLALVSEEDEVELRLDLASRRACSSAYKDDPTAQRKKELAAARIGVEKTIRRLWAAYIGGDAYDVVATGPETDEVALVEILRNAVYGKAGHPSWIRELSDGQRREIYFKLKRGQTPKSIAVFIQDEWKIRTNVKIEAMAHAIRKFKQRVFPELDLIHAKSLLDKKLLKKIKASNEYYIDKLDNHKRMLWAIELQTERIVDQRKLEVATGQPEKLGDKMVSVLGELCMNVVDMEVKTGLREVRPSETVLTIKHGFDRMIENSQDDGKTFQKIGQEFLKLCEENKVPLKDDAIPVKLNEDGTYSEITEDKNEVD